MDEFSCQEVWELAEGEGGEPLHIALEDKRREQELLRGLEPCGPHDRGGDPWPDAQLMAELALEGFVIISWFHAFPQISSFDLLPPVAGIFRRKMRGKVPRALSSDLALLQSLHTQVLFCNLFS